jgi:hypothetical protein
VTYNIGSGTTSVHASGLLEAIDDRGELVGNMIGGGPLPSAVLIRPDHPPIDLNSEVSTIQGWLVSATGITNDGRILVNAPRDRRGSRAWSPVTDVDRHDRTIAQA